MDLFVVKRFIGDEDHLAGTPSESILEKLHKKAEERKKQKQLKEKRLTAGGENQQNEADEDDRKEKKKKKKKRKYSEDGEDKRREEERRRMSRLEENGDGLVEVEEEEIKVEREIDERQSKVDGDGNGGRQNDGDKIEQVPKKKKRKKEKTEKWEKLEEMLERDVEENTISEELDGSVTKKRKNKKKKQDKKTLPVSSDDVGENSAVGDERTVNGEVKGEVGENTSEGNDEGLFPVLGDFSHSKKQKVKRVLPEWLASPSRISGDIQNHSVSLDSVSGLDERILAALKEMEISTFFPVQEKVIPMILQSARHGIYMGPGGYRPGDLCVAAPTGSGKTLAFTVPIVQILIGRVVQHFRALVVLPTKNLATQVYKVFLSLCHKTPLKVVMIGGQRSIQQEEGLLVKKSSTGEMHCGGDILVATPGRLIDHINWTKGFSLKHLRFLVIDEADSMMVQLSKDWITRVENAVFGEGEGQSQDRHLPSAITVESESRMEMPLQKVLFSATLSHNPEQLMQLKLFQPRLVTSVMSPDQKPTNQVAPKEDDNQDHGNYIIPSGLEEHYIVCTSGEKPLIILHMLKNLGFSQVLCFTNSVESSHRLYRLTELMGGITVGEFSSKLSGFQRQAMIKQFKNESIQLLICSDAMTRGMDLSNARYVVSYDPPLFLKTYIHRVGRTARAGRKGTAYTILLQEEKEKFHKIMGSSSSKRIQEHIVTTADLEVFMDNYEKALKKLSVSLKGEAYQQKNR